MISVIIPMYNAAHSIEKCLDSVKGQTYGGDFEIIIINDGSVDRSAEVVKWYISENPDMRIKLIHQHNQGVSKARNQGLKVAGGDFIALLDADDEWLPEKTEKQMKLLKDEILKIDFISCIMNENKLLFPYFPKNHLAEVTFRKLLIRNGIPTPTVIFKRKVIENTGYFDSNQKFAEDHNYWLKISEKNRMYILDESLVIAGGGKRTFGVSGLSANLKEMEKGFRKNLRDMMDSGRITFVEYVFYRILYKIKYFVLIIRNMK